MFRLYQIILSHMEHCQSCADFVALNRVYHALLRAGYANFEAVNHGNNFIKSLSADSNFMAF